MDCYLCDQEALNVPSSLCVEMELEVRFRQIVRFLVR